MIKSKKPVLTIEDCGRWLCDYVLSDGEKVSIESLAKNLPRDILKKAKRSPEHAKAILEVYSDINPTEAESISDRKIITKSEYTKILNLI